LHALDGAKDTSVINDEYTRLQGALAPSGSRDQTGEVVIVPTLYEATPYPVGPRYFARHWNLARATLTPVRYKGRPRAQFGMPLQLFSTTPGRVRAFGYSCRSPHSEDREMEDLVWARGKAFPGVCFSKSAPSGEYGFTPAAAVVEITLDTLERELAAIGIDWIQQNAS
jgi:hypothetical protein